jgi:3-oxoacyl-[acyl-carrier protein] reductase
MAPTTDAPPPSQVALVTGGSRGIGRAVAEALLEQGWRVAICSRNPDSVAEALAELSPRYGDRISGRAVDVRDQAAVDAFVSSVVAVGGRLDCVVNNAGLGTVAPVDELTGEQWREVVETNLSGAFYVLRAAAQVMKQAGTGWIFNVASLAGRHASAGGAAYNASKFGMIGLSEAAMLDLRGYGVRVAAILPGSVATDFTFGSGSGGSDWKLAPEDVATMIVHLLSYPARALPSLVEIRPTRTGK